MTQFAPEAKGHGVPEGPWMPSIIESGVIRPVGGACKVAGLGDRNRQRLVGWAGRAQSSKVRSALGSTIGQIIRMPAGRRRSALVAAGAGAGIASTFNTPIGGVMFAIELMLPEVSVDTFLPVRIATGTATFIGRWFFGDAPTFHVPPLQAMAADPRAILVLVLFAVLGALTGVAAAGFTRGLHWAEDIFDRIKLRYLRPMLGMLMVGVLMYLLFRTLGQYYIDGVGYATVQAVLLTGQISTFWLLGLLSLCKALATSLSLGSSSSGGGFSRRRCSLEPRWAAASRRCSIASACPIQLSIPAFAAVGMGAMVGGGTGAVMTAVAMIFEMTLDFTASCDADDCGGRHEHRCAPGALPRDHPTP